MSTAHGIAGGIFGGADATLARLASGPVYGAPVARCAGCPVPLVELALPVRIRVVTGGQVAGVVLTHAHAAVQVELGAAGRSCAWPSPARCASPRCRLYAVPGGRWCDLCGQPDQPGPVADEPNR